MASFKRTGFFWGEEKLTLVEFEKNTLRQAVSTPLGSKSNSPSPFSPNFTEEIQVTSGLQKLLQDNRIESSSFYVSLPMKEIILRSFVIPYVNQDEVQNAIKFEAKKYLPIDIQDLTFTFYVSPFTDNKVKRMQVIFFAVRNETLARYKRIFNQINADVIYGEPCMVSLTKVLLFKKEINPTDHLAFLILEKNVGRICFIDKGIPQFIREFTISTLASTEETRDSIETLNLRIVNEVGNSFDFYARQFNGERIDQMLVSSGEISQDLIKILEGELKLKIRKSSSVVKIGAADQGNELDAVYAMGACVEPAIESLSRFNFLEDKTPKAKFSGNIFDTLASYKEVIFVLMICTVILIGVFALFQVQLKVAQQQYDQLSEKQGSFVNIPVESIQNDIQQNIASLAAFKNIRTKSDIAFILFKVASHLPQGASLKNLNVKYDPGDVNNMHVSVDMNGDVFKNDPNEEIAVVNRIFSDFKNDKDLAVFFKNVTVSLNLEQSSDRQVTGFTIHCS